MADIQIKLPNGQHIPFSYPDEWTDDQLKSAVEEQMPKMIEATSGENESYIEPSPASKAQEEQEPETKGFSGIMADALRHLSKGIEGGIGFAREYPEELPAAWYQIAHKPLREAGQFGAGAAELAKGVINNPKTATSYLAKKELGNDLFNQLQKQLAELVPGIPEDTGIEKALGLDTREPGENLIRAAPGVTGLLKGGEALAKGGVGLAKKALEGKKEKLFGKKLQEQLEIQNQAKIENSMDEALEKAKEEHNLSAEELEATKNALRLEFIDKHASKLGERTPVGQQEKALEKKAKIKELKPLAEVEEKEVGEIPAKETGAEKEARIIEEAKTGTEAAKQKLSETLSHGKIHEVEAGQRMVQGIENLKNSASDIFNKARSDVRGVDVPIDKSAEINKIKEDISKLQAEDKDLPGYAFETPELQDLNSKLAEVSKEETIPASHLLDVYTSLNKWVTEARKQIYKRGSKLDDVQKTKLQNIIEGYNNKAEKLGEILETASDNPEFQADIKEARGIWRKYSELWDNPVGKNLLLHGKIPAGTISKLTGTTKGNEFLNGLVEADPEIAKHILGQMYSKPTAVKGLLEKHDITEPYKRMVEGVFEDTEGLRTAIEREKEANVEGAQVRTEHEKLVESMKEAAKVQIERKRSIEQIDKLNSEIDSHVKAADKIEQKLKIVEAKAKKLNEVKGEHTQEQKRIEQEHKASIKKLELELKEHQNKMEAKRIKVKNLAGYVFKGLGIKGALGMLGF